MSKTILVVDDEMLIALDIQTQLEERGHHAIAEATLAGALKAIETRKIDMAILDFRLGSAESTPLAQALAERKVPFVVCSASSIDEVAEVFTGAPYVPKPFSPDDLETALEKAARLN